MKSRVYRSLGRAILLLAITASLFNTGQAAAQSSTNTAVIFAHPRSSFDWTLVWSDEFNGPNGSPVDPSHWNYDTGGAWGNGSELQYYTNRIANSSVADGLLQITARRENYRGNRYTSARLQTKRKFSQLYGRFEARIKIPAGKGIWPAFWLIGDNIDKIGWPACGEIDIMEHVNQEARIFSTLHMPSTAGRDTSIGAASLPPDGIDYSLGFHLFAVEWEPDALRFYVDDTLFQTVSHANLRPNQRWVFDHPYFIVLNVAVGGPWPGAPDRTTVFPAVMQVDYVRVYEHSASGASYLPPEIAY